MHCPTKHETGQLNKHGVVLACASAMRDGSGRLPGAWAMAGCIWPPAPAIIEPGKCNTTLRMFMRVAIK